MFYCSFCGKSQDESLKLIAGPDCYICDKCVKLCNEIIIVELQNSVVSLTNQVKNLTRQNTLLTKNSFYEFYGTD